MSVKSQEQVPPIIDREIFFGNPEIAGAQLSPDGQYMSFIKPYKEVRNIWVKKTKAPFDSARPVTADTKRPIPGYFWSRDSKYLLYVQDKGGNEDYHVFALDPAEGLQKEGVVPAARNLTDIDGVRALIYRVAEQDADLLFIGLNDRDASWHDLYQIRISTGERTLMRENIEKISGWQFDNNDRLRLASRSTEDGGTEILRVDEDGFTPVYRCNSEETCYTLRFHKDNKLVYLVSNKGAENDLTQLLLLDPLTGETIFVESDPENQVDFGGAPFSEVTKEIIATVYIGDKTRIYFRDRNFEKDYELLKKELPGVEINLGSSTRDEQLYLVAATSDLDPGATYLFDRSTQTLTFQYRPRPKLPREHLAPMQPVRYKSVDDLEIPAYLTLPKGKEARELPAIIFIHGGPWARDFWGYHPYAQFWANRGYAVLQPNFRSSTGYGKRFLNAGNQKWGEEMQDDISMGVQYLIERGIADPARIGIMGGSYGGYATLAGLTFTPELYAAGISIVGPSNLITLLESIPPYWESVRKLFHKRMGDPSTEEGKQKLIRQSPLFSADKIRVPLLVVQGANDPRVKKAESDQIVIAMRELGLPVEYIVAPDEGHGFTRPENNMAFIAASEKFFAKHLGGRYQEEMPEHIEKRLKEIKVDVQTVKLVERVADDVAKFPLPKPEVDPSAASYTYKMTIKMDDREIPMELARTVSSKNGNWQIIDKAITPLGKMEDYNVIEKESLLPIQRELKQGPVHLKIDHSAERIVGTMTMDGSEQALDISLDAPVFGAGAALEITLTALPLKKGYETFLRTFDVQSNKIRLFQLKVLDMEEVVVPAGTYSTHKVELIPLDNEGGQRTNWIYTGEARYVVKSTTISPQLGGAMIVTELSSVVI